jgi:hypothetical protein
VAAVRASMPQVCPKVGRGRRRSRKVGTDTLSDLLLCVVGATGFEPVTSSVSGKRSPAELRARGPDHIERVEAVPGIEPGYRVLQTLA